MWMAVWLLSFPTAPAADVPIWWQRAAALAKEDGYRLISAADLVKLYASQTPFRIVDVRTDYEYDGGHLPAAVHLTVDPDDRYRLKPDKQKRFVAALGPEKHLTVVLYCRNYT